MYLAQRSLHCAGGNQYHFELANLGASYDPSVPAEHDVEKQACHGCGFWLRLLVSLPLRSSQKALSFTLILYSTIVAGVARLVYSILLSQTTDIMRTVCPALWA